MMKRLIDEPVLENTDKRLAALLRAAAPFEVDPFRRRRVLVNLSRLQSPRASHFWSRPLVVAAVLASGTAGAQLGRGYAAHGSGFLGSRAAVPSGAPNDQREPSPTPLHSGLASVRVDPPTAGTPFANEQPGQASTSGTRAAAKSASQARPDSSEDAASLVEAIQALRVERDPSRAQALLNYYLRTQPKGVLSEDALALSIEAASALRDPHAADYARRYLVKFPHGKYRALAGRAIAQK